MRGVDTVAGAPSSGSVPAPVAIGPAVQLRPRDLASLRAVFTRFPGVVSVHLFGSRATGTAHRISDIDVAVSAPGMSAREWADLEKALIEHAPIIHGIELVRLDGRVGQALRAAIARDGVALI